MEEASADVVLCGSTRFADTGTGRLKGRREPGTLVGKGSGIVSEGGSEPKVVNVAGPTAGNGV